MTSLEYFAKVMDMVEESLRPKVVNPENKTTATDEKNKTTVAESAEK